MSRESQQKLRVGRIAFDALSFDQALARVETLARSRHSAYVVTPNADHVVRAERDPDFVRICAEADLVLADGMPIVWASRLLPVKLPMRIAGSDFAPALCAAAAARGMSVYLLGGMPGEAERAAQRLLAQHPHLQIAGTYCPPFGFEHDTQECQGIVRRLNAVKPDIVLVGVGSPKQEKWIAAWRDAIDCGVLIGVGATIGFMAGTLKRAPLIMQRTGTEWLYRLVQEPRRLVGRYVKDLEILLIVGRTLWTEKKPRFQQSVKKV